MGIRSVGWAGSNEIKICARRTLFPCVRVSGQKAIRGMVQEFESREVLGYTVSIGSFGLPIASEYVDVMRTMQLTTSAEEMVLTHLLISP